MARFQAEKFVVACFLEAVKTTMDQLGRYRMELGQRVRPGSSDLVALYSEIRRLRDYLQRCFGAFPDQVELDLGVQDMGLAVACARRAVEVLDVHMESSTGLQAQERDWLEKKRQVLTDWAVEFAQKPLVELPLPPLRPVVTAGLKMLDARLQTKVNGIHGTLGPVGTSGQAAAARPGAGTPAPAPRAPLPGLSTVARASTPPPPATPAHAPVARPPTPARPAAAAKPAAKPAAAAPAGNPGGLSALMASPPTEPAGDATPAPSAWELRADSNPRLIDLRQIRDPRLRSLMTLDLRAYERAVEFGDKRLAALHLASILEGALLDHAVPRRAELGLIGSPDSWSLHDLLLSVLGTGISPQDRGLVYQLFATRNLIRPAVQLVAPAIITAQSFERLSDFVARALRQLGFRSEPDPADAQGQQGTGGSASQPGGGDAAGSSRMTQQG
jgi:hypothetical protein